MRMVIRTKRFSIARRTRLHVTVDNEDALYVIYPTIRSGADLRQNRAALLQTLEPKAAANSQNQQ